MVVDIIIDTCSWIKLFSGFGGPPGLLNGNGPLGGTGEVHMESMVEEATATSGGPGPFTFGLREYAPAAQGMDQSEDRVKVDNFGPAPKELEIITVTSMQIPCRCTNSYAYL